MNLYIYYFSETRRGPETHPKPDRFGFGDGFPPESVSGLGLGFDFGFRFWVHGDSTRSEPDPLPSLLTMFT